MAPVRPAARPGRGRVVPPLLAILLAFGAAPARADDQAPESSPPKGRTATSIAGFVGGAAAGFLAHEGGHLFWNVVFDADPGVKRVSFGGIPFFAITHRSDVTPRQEFTISSAGFWVQHATSEWILTSHPDLRRRHAPVLKGWLAWNVAASVAYGAAAFGTFGPPERDTRGMAGPLGVAEPWVGAMILAPAVLDTWRYVDPGARWPRWTSRIVKVGLVVAVVAANER